MDVLSEYYLRKTITVSKRRLLYHFKTFGHRYLCEKLIISERILTDGLCAFEDGISLVRLCAWIGVQKLSVLLGALIEHTVIRKIT